MEFSSLSIAKNASYQISVTGNKHGLVYEADYYLWYKLHLCALDETASITIVRMNRKVFYVT